ncbi:RHS repeat protein [Pseudoxanthomonas winnipegensis]|nr:RHS repeat protein [Pseudoxanthomonas winnipegensis]
MRRFPAWASVGFKGITVPTRSFLSPVFAVLMLCVALFFPRTAAAECVVIGAYNEASRDGDWLCDSKYEAYTLVSSFTIPPASAACDLRNIQVREEAYRFVKWASYPGNTCGQGYVWEYSLGSASWRQGGEEGPEPGLSQGPPLNCTQCVGDPVNAANGNKFEHKTEFTLGADQLSFGWTYNSMEPVLAPFDLLLGTHRTHTFSWALTFTNVGNRVLAKVLRPDGKVTSFYSDNGGPWVPSAPDGSSLITLSGSVDTYAFQGADGVIEDFDTNGRLAHIRYLSGSVITVDYDTDGNLASATDQQGRKLIFSVDSDGLLYRITTPDNSQINLDYDQAGLLWRVHYQDLSVVEYLYDESGHAPARSSGLLTGVISEAGVRISSTFYDSKSRAISTDMGGIGTESISYDSAGVYGIPTSVAAISALGAVKNLEFSVAAGRVLANSSVETAGELSIETDYEFSPEGQIKRITRGSFAEDRSFNPRGLIISRILGRGTPVESVVQTDWSTDLALPAERRILDSAGKLIASQTWTYNSRGQALTVTQVDPATSGTRSTTTTYCEQPNVNAGTCPLLGLVSSVNGARTDVGDLTAYTYYLADHSSCISAPTTCPYRKGDLWKVTDALGHVTETLAYDGAGRPLSVKDPNGVITDYEYHPRGWLTATKVRGTDSSTESDDRITRIEYWPTGLVKRVTQPDGAFTTYTYDAAHRLTDVSDNAGNTIHYTLDNAGNRIAEDTKDANGNLKRTLSRVYNQLGQLATQADAVGNPTDYGYDANGNATSATDALSRVTQSEYDPLNRLKRTLQDVGGIAAETKFAYDALDNLTEVTDPKGLKTAYTYNGLGDLTKQVSPDTGTTLFTYDSAGNRITQKDARSKTTTYSYDALNRLTGIAYANTSFNVTYTYDANQSVCTAAESFPVGRLTKMQDGSGTTQYCYNRFGDLTRKVQTVNGVALTLRYSYAPGGQLTAMTYPDGAVVDYVRDTQGRITEVGVKPSAGARQVLLTGATYHPFGPAAGWTYGNGRQMTRTVDLDYRPAAIHDASTGGLAVGFNYDEVGNLVELTQPGSTLPQVGLGYDALGRLTQFKDGPTGTVIDGYGYDKTGNRTSLTTAAGTSTYSYPTTSHRLTNVGGIARTYDAAGNTTGINGTAKQFVYDDTGRMSSVKAGGTTTRNYKYNGKGERVRSYLSTANTYTLYDEAGHWIGDYGANGTPVQQAIWMDDLPVGLRTAAAGTVSYIEPDHLGSPRVVIDPVANTAIWKWDIKGEAFGATAPEQDPDGNGTAFNLDMRFPGQQYDSATGLAYNYFRDYENVTGRYVHSDPIGLYGGLSTYGYAGHSPLLSLDRLGLQITFPVPVESPIFLPRPTPTPVDPVLMPMSPPSDIPYVTYEDPSTGTREQCPGPCEGLLRQLREHERKLREYRSDPMKYDNKGFLRNAPPNIKENIIDGRLRNLENQINNFRRQYMDCLAKNGGTIA